MPPQQRSISRFFKPPAFAVNNRDSPPPKKSEPPAPAPQSSPLTEPSSSFLSNAASPQTPDGPASQLKRSLLRSLPDETEHREHQPRLPNADDAPTAADPSSGSSFNLSQRIVKNGKEIVISSDGEDTDSIESLEAPEDLFMRLMPKESTASSNTNTDNDLPAGKNLRTRRSKDEIKPKLFSKARVSTKSYKNSLDSLVTQAVDDNETEADILKLRALLDLEKARNSTGPNADKSNQLDEGVLTSVLGEQDDEMGLRRLLDAVRRTEAFDLEKSWSFFEQGGKIASPLKFPRYCAVWGTYLAILRDPESRERAFHSGVIDFALSRGLLDDKLITWIFHSVPSEPREGLRHAYCRVFKNSDKNRIKKLIQPDTIDILFQRLGANPKALDASEPIIPSVHPPSNLSHGESQHQAALLSVLDMLRGAAESLSDDSREHLLNILLRLTLDITQTHNQAVCSELERTITAILESIPDETADDTILRICTSLHKNIKDAAFQSRLLKHILPTSSWIATIRCRLAMSFFTNDLSPLTSTPDTIPYLQRITDALKDKRFDVKRFKGKGKGHGHTEYDYGELGATTALLNIIIDSGWSGLDFGSKAAEREFNAEVDALADRIKKIFTSIEDAGASHLKRTLAKESLEALHYRIVYSVRSRPRPKKSIFGDTQREHKQDSFKSFIAQKTEEDAGIPIRAHEEQSGA